MGVLTAGLGTTDRRRPALIDDRGITTWAELDERVDRAINAFRSAGLTEGDVVVTMMGNQREFFEVSLACLQSGLLMVPVNWHWVADELQYVVDDAGASALVVDERWSAVADAVETDAMRIDVGTGTDTRWEDLLASASADEPTDQVRGGVMFYTSGTTGRPKGVRSTLGVVGGDPVMWQLIAGMAAVFDLPDDDPVFLLSGPAYHSAQWVFSLFSLLQSATVVMQHKFDAAELLGLVERHRVTNLHLVPTQFTRLLRLPDDVRSGVDLSSVAAVHHGAAPCPTRVKREMIEWFGPVVSEYYGGTEGGFITMISAEEWLERPGSVGRPLDVITITVTDDEGNEVPPGVTGQLWFQSALGSDFEYHNAPDKTEKAHRAAGVGTLGDVGHLDEDGYLFLSDRKIDMIISGGVNIYPAEIEAVLCTDPSVDDAAVIGTPDDEFGESVHAIVEVSRPDGVDPDAIAARLEQLCRSHLAGYKCPRSIEVVGELPRSEAGKVLKRELRDARQDRPNAAATS